MTASGLRASSAATWSAATRDNSLPLRHQRMVDVGADIFRTRSICLLRGSCALSRIVLRKKSLNYRACAGFVEHVKQFVCARRAAKIVIFRHAWMIGTARDRY